MPVGRLEKQLDEYFCRMLMMKRLKLTPILIYAILIIVDNLLYLPIWGGVSVYFNQGALGNVLSLVLIGISAVCIVVERWVVWNRTCGKRLVLIEVGLVLVTTLFYWLLLLRLPFPTLNRIL